MITVAIRDYATPELMRMVGQVRTAGPLQAAGQRVAVALRRHFQEANATRPNRKGWPRQNFWAAFARRVALASASPTRAIVRIQDPQGALRHKLTGGTIRAKRGKMLAIPLTGEAYRRGAMARIPDAFPDAFLLRTQRGAYIVRGTYQTRGSGRKRSGIKGQRLQFLYRLVPSVTQAADPQALPAPAVLGREAAEGLEGWIRRNTVAR